MTLLERNGTMSKMKALLSILLVGAAWASVAMATKVPRDVTLCHKGKTIVVSGKELRAHMAHGDCLRRCEWGCPEPHPVPWATD